MFASTTEIASALLDETVPVNQLLQKFSQERLFLLEVPYNAPARSDISPRILVQVKIRELLLNVFSLHAI
jgi:hypothetical protein